MASYVVVCIGSDESGRLSVALGTDPRKKRRFFEMIVVAEFSRSKLEATFLDWHENSKKNEGT